MPIKFHQMTKVWDKDGNLVIVFDKYEVAPGGMGTPEFVIEKGSISDILKPEYR